MGVFKLTLAETMDCMGPDIAYPSVAWVSRVEDIILKISRLFGNQLHHFTYCKRIKALLLHNTKRNNNAQRVFAKCALPTKCYIILIRRHIT